MTDRSPAERGVSFAESFMSTGPERDALAEDELVPLNLDIPKTVSAVLGLIALLAVMRAGLRSRRW